MTRNVGIFPYAVNPIRSPHSGPAVTLAHLFHRLTAPWLDDGLDLLFPPRCVFCQDDLGGGRRGSSRTTGDGRPAALCAACRRTLASDHARCLACGGRSMSAGACGGCRHRRHGCAGLAVLGTYGDALREAVLRCKRPEGEPLARALADMIVDRHRGTFAAWQIDLIVPVPMHWRRRIARGTSAADELAAGIARRIARPCRRALQRRLATPMQNELPAEHRRGNVADAFRVRACLAGRCVLLVDDVCTTGSTLAACSAAVLAAGAKTAHAAVVATAEGSAGGGDS